MHYLYTNMFDMVVYLLKHLIFHLTLHHLFFSIKFVCSLIPNPVVFYFHLLHLVFPLHISLDTIYYLYMLTILDFHISLHLHINVPLSIFSSNIYFSISSIFKLLAVIPLLAFPYKLLQASFNNFTPLLYP